MNTQNINATSFNAKLMVRGIAGCKKPASLLPQKGLKRLNAKANTIGTDSDIIYLGLWDSFSVKRKINPAAGFIKRILGLNKITTFKFFTNVCASPLFKSRSYIFDTIDDVISGTSNQRKMSTYKTIWKYLDSINEKYNQA